MKDFSQLVNMFIQTLVKLVVLNPDFLNYKFYEKLKIQSPLPPVNKSKLRKYFKRTYYIILIFD